MRNCKVRGLRDVVERTGFLYPACPAVQLEQVNFLAFYLQKRNNKFYLIEFFEEIHQDNIW